MFSAGVENIFEFFVIIPSVMLIPFLTIIRRLLIPAHGHVDLLIRFFDLDIYVQSFVPLVRWIHHVGEADLRLGQTRLNFCPLRLSFFFLFCLLGEEFGFSFFLGLGSITFIRWRRLPILYLKLNLALIRRCLLSLLSLILCQSQCPPLFLRLHFRIDFVSNRDD